MLTSSPGSGTDLADTGQRAGENAIVVRSTARLHLGFLDLNGSLGRRFGSIGMALDGPETVVRAHRGAHSIVTGAEHARATRYLVALESALDLPHVHAVQIKTAIPGHAGLGSGTQLALSIAAAVRGMNGLQPDPRKDAAMLGRGARSGIGIALFQSGGLVLDGGRAEGDTDVPPLLAHLRVPDHWRVLLLRDLLRRGLSGVAEHDAFAALPPMPENHADRLCRLALMQALPALAEGDLAQFGAAITEIQRLAGAYFAPAQGGGACASPAVAAALECLRAAGATGLGQTSWGPTGFAFVAADAEAARLVDLLRRRRGADTLDISVRRPRNRGAEITRTPQLSATGGEA